MERFVKGDIVVVPFPFTDFTQTKRRPALIVAPLQGDDVILCQITSHLNKDIYSIPLDKDDFDSGELKQASNVRPNKLFTADNHIVLYRIGRLKSPKFDDILDKIISIVKGETKEKV